MPCPIRELINAALRFIRAKDPSWDVYQPRDFRKKVIESWKQRIQVQVWHQSLCWSLEIGDQKFEVISGLFRGTDRGYNPYA